jgi:TolB protein
VIGTLAWSGDSTEVYYRAGDNNIEIYLMNADGTNPRRVTNSQQDDFAPALSPDGKQIVFSASGTLALINADGSGMRLLSEVFGVEPNWSPDGKQIVFSGLSNDSSGRPLTIVNADGSGLKVISDPKGFYDGWASFSPDGKQIVFYSNRDGRGKIFVMNPDGTNRRQLTTDEGDENYPAWSPDGKQIIYVNRNADPFGIYTMNADGSNRTLVYEAAFPLKELSWSGDDRILFTSEEAGNSELYVLNLKDKKITRLTNVPSSDEYGKFGR